MRRTGVADGGGSMKSEDLISRQAATEAASRGCYELRGVFMQVKEKLDELPPVDAVPVRRGRWEQMYSGKFVGGAYWFSCSECKRIVPGGLSSGYNFCPECGADMRGEKER